MNYAIQDGLLRGHHETAIIDVLHRMDLPVFMFKHVPFTEDLIFITEKPGDHTFPFCSVRAAWFVNNYGWKPGSFHNENHDFQVYSKHWGDNLLNSDSRIQRLIDPIPEEFFFARPTGDTKLFKGETYGRSMWEFTRDHGIANGADPDALIQVCSAKEIMQEVRCFVVKGKIITASFYKIGDTIRYQECNDEDLLAFAQEMVDHFQLADAFVIDVCRTDKGLKIVETNCINCSGFYDINLQKLVEAIESNF